MGLFDNANSAPQTSLGHAGRMGQFDTANSTPQTSPGLAGRIARGKAVSKAAELQQRAQAAKANPAEAATRYDAARKSMFGKLSTEPASICAPCLASEKAARRKERLSLIASAEAAGCSPAACKRLREDMDEVENMRVAKHAYLANDPDSPAELRQPPPGFTAATDEDLKGMGLTRDMLEPKGTNFRAVVCVKDAKVWAPPDPPDPKYVLAFRGSTPANEDWENNMMEGANETPGFVGPDGQVNKAYHQRAVEIGKTIGAKDPAPSLHFVGHSLGGGLATAAQGGSGGASGRTASTYNSAGVHEETAGRYGAAAADAGKIKAVRVKGEVLTKMQETGLTKFVMQKATGNKRDLVPATNKASYLKGQGVFDEAAAKAANTKFDADDEYAAYLHGMDVVIESKEASKQADQKELGQCRKFA